MTHDNPVDNWYKSDSKLQAIISSISGQNKSAMEQAMDAFELVSVAYNLPKFPDSFSDEDFEKYCREGVDNPRSVYEDVGIIRYLEPYDDPRGIVLCALYNIKNRTYTDRSICASRHFGSKSKIPKEYVIYFTGETADSKLNFLTGDESWTKPGVEYASKILNRQS